MNLPEGWKLVPVEPTKEMLESAEKAFDKIIGWNTQYPAYLSQRSYRAMIAAAPTPPAQNIHPDAFTTPEPENIADLLDDHAISGSHADDYPYNTKLMQEAAKLIRKLQTPPAQEDEPVAEIKLINGLPKVVAIVGYGDLTPGSLLYTRPDDKLRKAAEELIATYDFACKEDGCYASNNHVEALRDALEER